MADFKLSNELKIGISVDGALTLYLVPALPEKPLRAVFTTTYEGFTVKGEGNMAYTLPSGNLIVVAVSYKDVAGNIVDLPQGNVTWETSDTTILGVQPDANDDQTCTLLATGPIGNAQATCTGTNTDGSQVIATLDVTVVAGSAVTGTIEPQGESQPIAPHVEPTSATKK